MLINPTGRTVRNDKAGAGFYNAPRGNRLHKGVDFVADPGQFVLSPISGKVVRGARPYADSAEWLGVLIEGNQIGIMMFYLKPFDELKGMYVSAGQVIGIAQDISRRYGEDCTPHIHLQVEWVDPLLIMRGV